MQKFKYTAVNLQNQKIKGTFIAENETDLAEQLAKQSLYLVSAKVYSGGTPSAFFTLGTGSVSLKDMTGFCRQFAIMLNTHIPILDCIDILRTQHFTAFFKKILDVIYDDVKSGLMLSEALNKHKKVFPHFFRNMIIVGEKSGQLPLVFESLAEYYEKDSELKRKLKSAMAYPLMLLGMTVGIAVLMLGYVVPTFRNNLKKMDVEVSGFTQAVYDISDFLLANWTYMLLGVFAVALLFFLIKSTKRGKYFFDMLLMKLPLVGTIQQNMMTARFARAFGLLLSSGMDLAESMDTVEVIIGNLYMKKKFHQAAESVRQGMSLTLAFDAYHLFPRMMIQMITIGEKSGTVDEVLNRSCGFFDTQVEASLNSLTSKIQPILLLVMGAVVGTLFVAVYSPMLSIMNGLI